MRYEAKDEEWVLEDLESDKYTVGIVHHGAGILSITPSVKTVWLDRPQVLELMMLLAHYIDRNTLPKTVEEIPRWWGLWHKEDGRWYGITRPANHTYAFASREAAEIFLQSLATAQEFEVRSFGYGQPVSGSAPAKKKPEPKPEPPTEEPRWWGLWHRKDSHWYLDSLEGRTLAHPSRAEAEKFRGSLGTGAAVECWDVRVLSPGPMQPPAPAPAPVEKKPEPDPQTEKQPTPGFVSAFSRCNSWESWPGPPTSLEEAISCCDKSRGANWQRAMNDLFAELRQLRAAAASRSPASQELIYLVGQLVARINQEDWADVVRKVDELIGGVQQPLPDKP